MKSRNLISVYQGDAAIESSGTDTDKHFTVLKKHEIRNMQSFCEAMTCEGCSVGHFDGFYVSYTIAQIGKEFDLLRFGTGYILNIEIKSELKVARKEQKIQEQMRKNHYYLNFLGKPVKIYTFVENDGFYEYDSQNNKINTVPSQVVAQILKSQTVDYSIDPDKEFIPSNYLISPFNSTSQFIAGEYFLTSAQQRIKDEINSELEEHPFMFFCISANAGTGKTLLMYDIAKEQITLGKKVKLIHCGILNEGHIKLKNDYGWDIISIRDISKSKDSVDINGYDFIFVDESQRIRSLQLRALVEKAIENGVPIVFSFDTHQYLRDGETLNLTDFLKSNYPSVNTSTKTLTNKIRTNKAMASFITNLMNIGKSKDNLNYNCVTIEYMDLETLKEYYAFLEKKGGLQLHTPYLQLIPTPTKTYLISVRQMLIKSLGRSFPKWFLPWMSISAMVLTEGSALVIVITAPRVCSIKL